MKILSLICHYAIFSLSILILFSILYWVYYHYSLYSIKRIYTEFITPAILALLITLMFISPKISGLAAFEFNTPRLYNFLLFLAALGMFIPMFCSSQYMQFFLPQKQGLLFPSEITSIKRGTYYQFKECYADKQNVFTYVTGNSAGKSDEYHRTQIYFICPLINTPKDTVNISNVKLWTGTYFSRSESRYSRPQGLQSDFEVYKANCLKEFLEKDYSSKSVYYSPQSSGFRDNFISAIQSYVNNKNQEMNLLIPLDNNLTDTAHKRLLWVVISYIAGIVLWSIIVGIAYFRIS